MSLAAGGHLVAEVVVGAEGSSVADAFFGQDLATEAPAELPTKQDKMATNAPPKKAPTKRAAPPESTSTPRASKKAFTSPYHEFCQEQRPLLMPLGMANRDRERLLGELAP